MEPKRIVCELPGHEDEWVELFGRPITIGQKYAWAQAEPGPDTLNKSIREFISDFHLRNVNGQFAVYPGIDIKEPWVSLMFIPVEMEHWLMRVISSHISEQQALPLAKKS